MPELYWSFNKYQMSPAAESINDVYSALVQAMQTKGWSGVQHQKDVHGYKSGIDLFAAVVFLPISGSTFWEGVAVGGGSATSAQANQEIQELQSIIANLNFL